MMTENIVTENSIRRPATMKEDDFPLSNHRHHNQHQNESSTCNNYDEGVLTRPKDGDKSNIYNATSLAENSKLLKASKPNVSNTPEVITMADETKIDVDHDDTSSRMNEIFRSPPPPAPPSHLLMTSPTTSAVKESTFQATFAEQTASEMKEIMDWYHYKDSSVATPSAATTTPRTSSTDGDDEDSNNNNTHSYGSELASSVLSPHSHFFSRNSFVDDEEVDEFDEWHSHANVVETSQSNGESQNQTKSGRNQVDADASLVASVGDDDLAGSPHQAALTHGVIPTQPLIQLPTEVKGNLEARTQQREVDRLCNITQEMEDYAKSLPEHDANDDSSLDLSISGILSIPIPTQLSPFKTSRSRTPDKDQDAVADVSDYIASPVSSTPRPRRTNRVKLASTVRSRWYHNFKQYLQRKESNAIEKNERPSKMKMMIATTRSNIGACTQIAARHVVSILLFLAKLYLWGFIHSFALLCLTVEIILTEFGFEIALVGIFFIARKYV